MTHEEQQRFSDLLYKHSEYKPGDPYDGDFWNELSEIYSLGRKTLQELYFYESQLLEMGEYDE